MQSGFANESEPDNYTTQGRYNALLPASVIEPDPPVIHQCRPSDTRIIEPPAVILTVPPPSADGGAPPIEPDILTNNARPFVGADPDNNQSNEPLSVVPAKINVAPGKVTGDGTDPVKNPAPDDPVQGT